MILRSVIKRLREIREREGEDINEYPLTTRRGLMRLAIKSTVMSIAVYGELELLALIKSPEAETKKELSVKYFNKDILRAVACRDFKGNVNLLGLFAVGAGAGFSLIDDFRDEIKKSRSRRLGLVGIALGMHALDLYSTSLVVKETEDPRFREYGFNEHIIESNLLYDKNLNVSSLKTRGAITGTLIGVASYFFPQAAGIYFPFGLPPIYVNNKRTARVLRIAYKVGDRVKEMLGKGASEPEVREYLKNYSEGLAD